MSFNNNIQKCDRMRQIFELIDTYEFNNMLEY